MRLSGILVFSFASYAASSEYVGSKTCFGCHSEIYRSYTNTGMGRSVRLAGDLPVASLAGAASVPISASRRVFRIFRDKTALYQSETEENVFSIQHKLEYAVGSGANGMTFLVRRGNYLFEAPLSFYSKSGKWDLSPGYEQADIGFGRMVPRECVQCHAGRVSALARRPGAYQDPPFEEISIGCENCHGPGGAHVRTLGKKSGLIVNPDKLNPRLAENICVQCHQTGDTRVLQPGKTYADFRPGQWFLDTLAILKAVEKPDNHSQSDLLEHYTAMQASRCFRESAGKLSCLTCHDPHVEPSREEAPKYFRKKCLICHSTARTARTAGPGSRDCSLPKNVRLVQTPPDNCIGCHMPKRDVTQISHSALTNHRIPAREQGPLAEPPAEETDGLIVVNRRPDQAPQLAAIVRLQAYRDLAYRNPQYQQRYFTLLDDIARMEPEDPLLHAALGHRFWAEGDAQKALAHLKKALALNDPTLFLDLGNIFSKLGQDEEAIAYLKKGVDLNPYDSTLQKTLILKYIQSKRYSEARSSLDQYVASFPEDSFMRGLLAQAR
jgi:hypothetical protein